MDTKQLIYKGAQISYSVQGKGEPLVLLHGFLESKEMWNDYIYHLKENHLVIAIDLPGFGESQLPEADPSITIMANAVVKVLETEGVDKFVVVGHSMGGYVALNIGDRFADHVKGVCLFHSHASADTEEAKELRDRTIKVIERDGLGFVSNFIIDLYDPSNVELLRKEIQKGKEVARSTNPKGVIAALKAMRDRSSMLDYLTQMEVPLAMIAGKQDSRIPMQKVLAQSALSKDVQLLMLERVGHMGMHEAPNKCLKFIQSFMNYV